MIPKIIHYCWLSGDPYPHNVEKCMASWRRHLQGYELRLWDFSRFPRGKSAWVDEAFAERKYAFAADYIRAYALFHEGGFYLDTDVEVCKPLDPLLQLPYALGLENGSGCIDAGVMGSEPGNEIFKLMLDYYDRAVHFKNADGTLNMKPMPQIIRDEACASQTVVAISSISEFDAAAGKLMVFAPEYFSPQHIETRKIESTHHTFAIHHFAGSWTRGWPKYRAIIKRAIGPALTAAAISTKRALCQRLSRKPDFFCTKNDSRKNCKDTQ